MAADAQDGTNPRDAPLRRDADAAPFPDHPELAPGGVFADLELPDHGANPRRLSEIAGGDPTFLHFFRGWWCPKEQAFLRRLVSLQQEAEVAYCRFVSVSVDPPETNAAFRAGLGARWTFLSDPDRVAQARLRPARDDRHRPRPLRARRVLLVSRSEDPRRVQRLLVLGTPDQRGDSPGPARDHARDPRGLGRPRAMTPPAPLSWCWLALVAEPPAGADAVASALEPDGSPAGVLAAWARRGRPVRHAVRADVRILDRHGAGADVSLVLAPAGVRVLFDDPAVQQARREILAGPAPDLVTTLLSDASHFEGALSAWRGAPAWTVRGDPFARIFPARRLRIGPGLLGVTPPLAGPTIERYGSARPWPWDRFADG